MRVFKQDDCVIVGQTCTNGNWFVYYIDNKACKQYVCRKVDQIAAEWSFMYYKHDCSEVYLYEENDYESYEVIFSAGF